MATIRITTAPIAIPPKCNKVSLAKKERSELAKIDTNKKRVREITLKTMTAKAYLPICLEHFSSFSSKNVYCSEWTKSLGFVFLANKVFSPTQQIRALP